MKSVCFRLVFLTVVAAICLFGCATMSSKMWPQTIEANSIYIYEDFIMRYPHSFEAGLAQGKLRQLYHMDQTDLSKVEQMLKNRQRIDDSDLLSRLLIAGANCLNDDANWIDQKNGRIIYNALKEADNFWVVATMIRVVMTNIERKRVLFLSVKLGLPKSEEALNNLLLSYGDKSMAEDYLNSGSSELHRGGEAWARINRYRINPGTGSHRVRWGSF